MTLDQKPKREKNLELAKMNQNRIITWWKSNTVIHFGENQVIFKSVFVQGKIEHFHMTNHNWEESKRLEPQMTFISNNGCHLFFQHPYWSCLYV